MSRRVLQELKKLNEAIEAGDVSYLEIAQNGDYYVFSIEGEGAYHDAIFEVQMLFFDDFSRAPEARFLTKIFHPSVDEHGLYCSPMLSEWKRDTTLVNLIEDVQALFTKQQFSTFRNEQAAKLFAEDRNAFVAEVRRYINAYCKQSK